MRLFIAINFTRDTVSRLIGLRDELQSRARRGNFSLDENLHLTLVFLGECDAKQTAVVKSTMADVRFDPFYLEMGRIGRFRRDGGDIWWAGVRAGSELLALQGGLTDRLSAAGSALERRKYSPHITLGREVMAQVQPWGIAPFGETVNAIDLMKSERINGKLTYTPIYTVNAYLHEPP